MFPRCSQLLLFLILLIAKFRAFRLLSNCITFDVIEYWVVSLYYRCYLNNQIAFWLTSPDRAFDCKHNQTKVDQQKKIMFIEINKVLKTKLKSCLYKTLCWNLAARDLCTNVWHHDLIFSLSQFLIEMDYFS